MSPLLHVRKLVILVLAAHVLITQAHIPQVDGDLAKQTVTCNTINGTLMGIEDAFEYAAEELLKTVDNDSTVSSDCGCDPVASLVQNLANNIVRQVSFVKQIKLNNIFVEDNKNREIAKITNELNAKLTECQKKVYDLVVQIKDEPINPCASLIEDRQVASVEHNTLNDCLPDIIKKMYANNLDNFESVLKLIEDLPWISHHYRGYESLFNEMNQNNQLSNSEIIRLAYLVKETITKASKLDFVTATKVTQPLENLKNRFPLAVRNLIWNGDCTIRHSIRNEYLYAAADDLKNQNGDRRVFTWIPDTQDKDASWKLWEFVPVNNATYFHLKNNYIKSHVHLSQYSPGSSSPDAAVACDNNCHNSTKWKVVFKDGYFDLINGQSGNYLTTLDDKENYDSERRNVFISETTGFQQGTWTIDCVAPYFSLDARRS